MRFIADTSVWSLFMRRRTGAKLRIVSLLRKGILENQVQMLGIIKQELLSGIRKGSQYDRINEILDGFPDLLAGSDDHLLAAKCFNTCRKNGVRGSAVDFLICAQAINHNLAILTTDRDFQGYAKYIPVRLI